MPIIEGLATTACLATVNKSKVTVLLVDNEARSGEGKSWIETASWCSLQTFFSLQVLCFVPALKNAYLNMQQQAIIASLTYDAQEPVKPLLFSHSVRGLRSPSVGV